MDAVYRIEGSTARTSHLAAGPWDRTMQHGAAPASLIAWAAERIETPAPMRIARLTADLLRPVPIAPLDIKSEVVRQGRKIQLCAISLSAGGVEVARGSVLKIREQTADLPPDAAGPPLDLPEPEAGLATGSSSGDDFYAGMSARVVRGGFGAPGPAAIWFRVDRPIVEGQPISAAMRAVVAADFCNGASAVLPFAEWTFMNADLTVSLARPPVGDWVLLDAETWAGPAGSGLAFARLADRRGAFGRAIQSLVIEPR